MRAVAQILVVLLVITSLAGAQKRDSASLLEGLSPDARAWVEQSCPRSLGPSLWSACVTRETGALSRGLPDLSRLADAQRAWVARSCPPSLGPSLYIACVNGEVTALSTSMPDTSGFSAQEQAWLQQSCPDSLGPSLSRLCDSGAAGNQVYAGRQAQGLSTAPFRGGMEDPVHSL